MPFWLAKAAILMSSVLLVVIPAWVHRHEARGARSKRYQGRLERTLLALVSLTFSLSLIWVATPLLAFADYPLVTIPFIAGAVCLAFGLWLLYRSHKDLGSNWSITLELRENHELITGGVYQRVRHPMYLALLLYASGQAMLVPNWVAGPSYLAAVLFLVALRIRPEERMMIEAFPDEFGTYSARTKRLIPGIW